MVPMLCEPPPARLAPVPSPPPLEPRVEWQPLFRLRLDPVCLSVLLYLAENGGSATTQDLIVGIETNETALSRRKDELVAAGFVSVERQSTEQGNPFVWSLNQEQLHGWLHALLVRTTIRWR